MAYNSPTGAVNVVLTLQNFGHKVGPIILPKFAIFGLFILGLDLCTITEQKPNCYGINNIRETLCLSHLLNIELFLIFLPGVPKKVQNFVQVLFNFETRYMDRLCLVR